jgi:hypothetical protein
VSAAPEFGFNALLTHTVGEIAKAVSERSGETQQQQFARCQAAIYMILGFQPRDVIEALLAGHCVMLHETMLSSTHETLLGEADTTRRSTRGLFVAMNKEFNSNLVHLERYQARPIGVRRTTEVPPAKAAGAGATSAPVATAPTQPGPQVTQAQSMQAATAGSAAQKEFDWLVDNDLEAKVEYTPSPEMVEACLANPDAMAAMAAGDPQRWAKALGVAAPSAAFLEAANTPGSPFDQSAPGPWPAATVAGPRKS